MAKDTLRGEQYQSLHHHLRSTVAGALSRQLDRVDLFLALPPEADMLLQRSAKAHHASPSQIISLVIEECGDLLRRTMSEALRYSTPAVRPVEAQPWPVQGADDHAQDFKARLLEREDHRFPVDRVRRHFTVSRERKRLLGMVAAHHDSNMTRIVETLLILGLSDPDIEPERSVKPDRHR
jgi:hypothetical protein